MNKKEVDRMLPKAYTVINETIAENGQVERGFRGQISTFGAAISMGSLLSAVSFFSEQAGSAVDRAKITKAIHGIICGTNDNNQELFDFLNGEIYPGGKYSWESEQYYKEKVVNAVIALKLALKLFDIDREAS